MGSSIGKTDWQQAEREKLDAIRRRLGGGREAVSRNPRQVRLAVTVRDPDYAAYPAQVDCPNTYWIVFVDGEFIKSPGRQTHPLTPRQDLSAAKVLAHNILDGLAAYCPLYTLVQVVWHNRQWWFFHLGTDTCSSSSSGSSSSGESSSSGPSSSGESSSSGPSSSGEESSAESSSSSAEESSAESSSSSGEGCIDTIGGVPLSTFPGYAATKKQALIHNAGCLQWMTIGPCDTSSSSGA